MSQAHSTPAKSGAAPKTARSSASSGNSLPANAQTRTGKRVLKALRGS